MSRPFDSARYSRLLEGLEITVLPFQKVNLGDRSDPEFYSKENLAIEHSLRDHHARPLGELCTLVASAFYPAATDLYVSGDVPFARCVDCVNYPVISKLQDDEFERIPRWFMEESGQIHKVGKGDIILTKVGTPCFASIVHDYDEIALSRTVLGLVGINNINPYYLTAYLRCRYGFNQLMRQREQTIQFQLTLERVREVLVYQASENLQKAVEKAMHTHIAALQTAGVESAKAEQILLHTLGLEDWRPPEPLTYTRRVSEVFSSRRLDAQFFAPRYSTLRKFFDQRYEVRELGNIGKVLKGIPVSYDDDGTVPIIRSGDLTDISEDARFLRAQSSEPIFDLQQGDVLISSIGFGSIGKVQVFDKPGRYGTVSEVSVIRQKHLNPYYLAIFLRSFVGQIQIERFITGATGQLHLYPRDVARIFVPLIPDREQAEFQRLSELIQAARREARDVLERAKRAVEVAIEESETTALEYLDQRPEK